MSPTTCPAIAGGTGAKTLFEWLGGQKDCEKQVESAIADCGSRHTAPYAQNRTARATTGDKLQRTQLHGVKTTTEATTKAVSTTTLVSGQSKSAEKPLQPERKEVRRGERLATTAFSNQDHTAQSPGVRLSDHRTVAGVGCVLTRMASASMHQNKTYFDSNCQWRISPCEYVKRLRRSFDCSDECYVMGLIYIDRLLELHPDIGINFYNCYNLLLTSIVLAAKFHDEAYHKNQFYAEAGYITTAELNFMEWRFLELLNWKLQIRPGEYNIYCDTLRQEGEEGTAVARPDYTCSHPQHSTSTIVRPCSAGQRNRLAPAMWGVAHAIARAMHN